MAVAVKKHWDLACEHQQTGEETRLIEGIYAGLTENRYNAGETIRDQVHTDVEVGGAERDLEWTGVSDHKIKQEVRR